MSEANVTNKHPENGSVPGILLSDIQELSTETDSAPDTPCHNSTSGQIEDDGFGHEVPPVSEIERDLDTLTYSGSTINDLELQLTRTKQIYQHTLMESRRTVEALRRKLDTHIKKSEPFIEIWRKARQVQEESNRSAMKFDKANSQYAAAKETIQMAETQLATRVAEGADLSSPSPLDQAWQETLNHATLKVAVTERERRMTQLEHHAILEKVRRVMDDYRNTEKKLRTHIIKSKPYYEQRYHANQRLQQLRHHIQELETKINESKKTYTATLKRLEVLNTEMHHRRASSQTMIHVSGSQENPRLSSSTGCSPQLGRFIRNASDTESLDSVLVPGGFTGSTGSLPSIGTSSVSGSPTSDEGTAPLIINSHSGRVSNLSEDDQPKNPTSDRDNSEEDNPIMIKCTPTEEEQLASELVSRCLTAAVHHVEETVSNQS